MTIKIVKKGQKSKVSYKSSKIILTPQDIKEADKFDNKLTMTIDNIERILNKKIFTDNNPRIDKIRAWYLIGNKINLFLKHNKVSKEEEDIFWESLYGRFSIVGKESSSYKENRRWNDFKIASVLATYPLKIIKKVGVWDLWRDLITRRAFSDKRVLYWFIKKISEANKSTRNEVRPFFKAISQRLKNIDTSVLTEKELVKKLKVIKWPIKTLLLF